MGCEQQAVKEATTAGELLLKQSVKLSSTHLAITDTPSLHVGNVFVQLVPPLVLYSIVDPAAQLVIIVNDPMTDGHTF